MGYDERDTTGVLTTMFAHNTWANLKLLEFCEQLNEEQLDTTALGGFGSIRDTLWHIIRAEVSYVYRVNGKLPATVDFRNHFPGFAVLKEAARWAGDELLQITLSAQPDTLVREEFEEERVAYRLASLMIQEITHASEHRAQIAAIITQLGMEPPDMSVWYYIQEIGEFTSNKRA